GAVPLAREQPDTVRIVTVDAYRQERAVGGLCRCRFCAPRRSRFEMVPPPGLIVDPCYLTHLVLAAERVVCGHIREARARRANFNRLVLAGVWARSDRVAQLIEGPFVVGAEESHRAVG